MRQENFLCVRYDRSRAMCGSDSAGFLPLANTRLLRLSGASCSLTHRVAENSNPQAVSNIHTESSASNSSIPTPLVASSVPRFSISPQRPWKQRPITPYVVAVAGIPLQNVVLLRHRRPFVSCEVRRR